MSFYADWFSRATAFFDRLEEANPKAFQPWRETAPPVTAEELDRYLQKGREPFTPTEEDLDEAEPDEWDRMPLPLPAALRKFHLEAPAAFLRTWWTRMPDAHDLDTSDAGGGTYFWHPPYTQLHYQVRHAPSKPDHAATFQSCTPWGIIKTLACLAVLNDGDPDNPQVVLFQSSNPGYRLSLNFREFLLAWEQACYLYPYQWETFGWAIYDHDRRWIELRPVAEVPRLALLRQVLFKTGSA